jgi:WD40 repeat protein
MLSTLTAALVVACCPAAEPPAPASPEVPKLIDQLGSENADVRKAAAAKLEALGEAALPALREAGKGAADADVRLRALVIAAAITRRNELEERSFVGHADGVNVLAVSPDGKRLASASAQAGGEHAARVWDLATGQELFRLEGHKGSVLGLAWSGDGSRLLTGSADGALILWDAKTGKTSKTIPAAHQGVVYYVALTPDGKKAVSCGEDRTVRVWDLATGKESASNSDNGGGVRGVSVSPDGKVFATTGYDLSVRLIDVETGKEVRKMDGGHAAAPWFSAFSPDGKLLATVADEPVVRLWDVATGKQVRTFEGHAGSVPGLAFSPDGKRLLTGGHDRTARLWDVATGKEVRKLEGHADLVSAVGFLPGGRYVVTASYDKTLRLWDLTKRSASERWPPEYRPPRGEPRSPGGGSPTGPFRPCRRPDRHHPGHFLVASGPAAARQRRASK